MTCVCKLIDDETTKQQNNKLLDILNIITFQITRKYNSSLSLVFLANSYSIAYIILYYLRPPVTITLVKY